MNTYRKTTTLVGILFIIGTASGILSKVLTGSITNVPDYLQQIIGNENKVVLSALGVLVMAFALAMIPALLYPILKKANEALALGYVIFRSVIETVGLMIAAISGLLLIPLSQMYAQAGVSDAAGFYTLGGLLNSLANLPISTFGFCIGTFMLYWLLYKTQLIPRWLSIWGLIGITLYIIPGFMILFGLQEKFATLTGMLYIPTAIQEMVMAVWLIAKGFTSSVPTRIADRNLVESF